MASGEQKRKPRPDGDGESGQAEAKASEKDVAKETDDLLDEIDEVLETNAEDFVKAFVQKGGE